MAPPARKVFLTGGTGYLGSRLLPQLLARGHAVKAAVRPASASRLPPSPGLTVVPGDALDPVFLRAALGDCDTWVQLLGTPKPAPWKAARFRAVDLRAATASVEALPGSGIRHYVYLSVAQPAPVMRAYIAVRAEGEARLRKCVEVGTLESATFLRPWYVLGPGHRWAYAMLPLYKIAEAIPATRAGALRTGLVTLDRMLGALVKAVEAPRAGVNIVEVPEIRNRGTT